jgi:ribose-phosphate pyrophosphokinase
MDTLVLHFEDEAEAANRLALAADLPAACIERHRFPDQELRLRLPLPAGGRLPPQVVLFRSLERPNEKLVELLLAARSARTLGATRLTLVAPYLAYMRQDCAFHAGEAVSQRIIGDFLAGLFDDLISVDPHLHRVPRLDVAVPLPHALGLSAAPLLARLIAGRRRNPLLVGPDAESAQWVAAAAAAQGFDFAVCSKRRQGDRGVDIELPAQPVAGRAVVLLDDVVSTGHTLACAASLLRAAGAVSVDVAVTHALFVDGALETLRQAGVGEVWSTDCIAHPSNALSVAPLLAAALQVLIAAPP